MRYIAMPRTRKHQQGVAAIEFALTISVLLVICFAIVSYGMLMWTQQKVSHIAGDSARVALLRSIEGNDAPAMAACINALDMGKNDWFLSVALKQSGAEELFCKADPVTCPGVDGTCLQLTITVRVNDLPRVVNIVQDVGNIFSIFNNTDGWIPSALSSTSTVKITDLSGV